jgi:hypothetical protein
VLSPVWPSSCRPCFTDSTCCCCMSDPRPAGAAAAGQMQQGRAGTFQAMDFLSRQASSLTSDAALLLHTRECGTHSTAPPASCCHPIKKMHK